MSDASRDVRITILPQADATALELRRELLADLGERYGAGEEGARPGPGDIVASLVARAPDGTPLGIAALRPFGPATLEVKRMYVRPQARRRGVARALLEALQAEARRLGATRIVLETGTAQPEAISSTREKVSPVALRGRLGRVGHSCGVQLAQRGIRTSWIPPRSDGRRARAAVRRAGGAGSAASPRARAR